MNGNGMGNGNNGNNGGGREPKRLYRSTSEAMLGGVASGLANYFNMDPTIMRVIFGVLTLFSSGTFILVYIALWLLIPTPTSTAATSQDVLRENVDDISARIRSAFSPKVRGGNGGQSGGGTGTGTGTGGGQVAPFSAEANGGEQGGTPGQQPYGYGYGYAPGQAPAQAGAYRRYGALPVVLIAVGSFILLAKLGLFHPVVWGAWWPLFLIGLGVFLLVRRRA